jgi:hypothetical protein
MCPWKFVTRELKMYGRLCFFRKILDRMRVALANEFYSSTHRERKSAMLLTLRFFRRIVAMNDV